MNDRAERPWWASDGPVGDGADPDEDPLERHRTARRGGEPSPDADAWRNGTLAGVSELADRLAAAAEAYTTDHDGHSADADGTPAGVCDACPICTGLRILGETRPELVHHLAAAGRHLAIATRGLVERAATPARPDDGSDDPGFERIDLA